MADGWLPGWERVANPYSAGGTYAVDYRPYPWRVVWHTTEGDDMPNTAAHRYPPHLWYDPRTRQKIQTVPLDRSSFAMYNANSHPEYTNKARAIQIELVGRADEAGNWPDQWLRNIAADVLAPICRWLQTQGGRVDLDNVPPLGVIPGSSYENAPQRLSWEAWARFDGCCGHRHVPGNGDRYDAGLLDMARISRYAAEALGGTLTPAEEEDLTPEQAQQLKAVHDHLGALTPLWQETFNHARGGNEHIRGAIDPLVRDVFNWSAFGQSGERVSYVAARFDQLAQAIEAHSHDDDGEQPKAEPYLDVEASLAQASDEQLLQALLARKRAG